MKSGRFLILVFGLSFVVSCSTSKNVSYKSSDYHKKEKTAKTTSRSKSHSAKKEVSSVLKTAHSFLGTPYKYGGTTSSGLDCSGLVINSYDAAGIQMPRISRDQAKEGKQIRLRDIREGDLVFFITSGSSINHVGIVEKVERGEVFFIHSSTSKGVIVSSLEETYWNRRFVEARRVL